MTLRYAKSSTNVGREFADQDGAYIVSGGAARDRDEDPLSPEQAEDLLLIDGFVRRPPPELHVLPLDDEQIAAHLASKHVRRAA